MAEPVLQVENLVKRYGDVEAVRGVSFTVAEGEVFGLLGPNGAGKTTTVEILEGLRTLDSGKVSVCGLDPQRDSTALKNEIGAALQCTSLPDKLKTFEALQLFSSFYSRRRDPEELLNRFGLKEKRHTFYSKLSGGQKQRLALAMALVNNPRVLFFDEPTAGLDPQVRREIYDIIDELRREKKTIVMTTHYIEEAERLCDRVAIVDAGKIIAMGTPREIQARTLGQSYIDIRTTQPMPADVPGFQESSKHVLNADRTQMTVYSTRPARTLPELVKWIDQHGIDLEDIHLKRPTLEDVFIELTGERLRE
jgi:ABC-2 type transport system ATP-binding protein